MGLIIRDGRFCGFELVINKSEKDMDEGRDGKEMSYLLKLDLVFESIKNCFNQAALAQE